MVDVDKAVVARLQKKSKDFEILVDPELAVKAKDSLKKGDADISEVLAVESIYLDSKKGLRASKNDMQTAFDTSDIIEVAKIIIKEGKIHTTSGQRDKERNDKWDKIVSLISINAVDAQTKLAIPSKTINDALHKAMFRLEDKKVEDQLQDAIKAVKKIIPLTFQTKTIQLNNLPPQLAGGCLEICKKLCTIEKQTWNMDKSLSMVVNVPAGLREELMDKINAITHGKVDMKLID